MDIAFPTTDEGGLDSKLAAHFGRCPSFTILQLNDDEEVNEINVIDNKSEHFGGSKKPPQLLENEDVDALVCSGIGRKAIQMFDEQDVEVFTGAEGTVKDCLELFRENKLKKAGLDDGCRC